MAMKTAAPHALSLRQLQYFCAVADALSFRRAADRCRVSQPALSAQIAELESGLGVQLFERSRKHVLLTDEGRALWPRAERMLAEADELVAHADTLKDPFAGALRLGVIPTVAPYLLPAVAPALREEFPRVSLAWVEDKTSVLLQRLQSGELDAAVLATDVQSHTMVRALIAKDKFMLAGAPSHPLLKARGPVPLGGLGDAEVLLLDDGHCLRDQALAVCARTKAHELAYRATSLSTLCHMVAGGAGVTFLPEIAASAEAGAAGLKLRAFASPAPSRTLSLVWRKGAARHGFFKALTQCMRAHYPASASGS